MVCRIRQRYFGRDRSLRRRGKSFENLRNTAETVGKLSQARYICTQCSKNFRWFFSDRKALARSEISRFDSPNDLNSTIYAYNFGNAVTVVRVAKVRAQTVISLREHKFRGTRVFSDVAAVEAF